MTAYYNEIDPFAADWLRELMKAGLIAPGEVDTRSIEDVTPKDLAGFTQCHWFAGIGVWSYALRRAGWPDDRPVWTGSCPCPPFSVAAPKKPCPECGGAKPLPHAFRTGVFRCTDCGHDWYADGRHLWPEFLRLIRKRRPVTVFGEQVAGRDGLAWGDIVQATLELEGYACGRVPFASCGVGAPHIRQRLYWVAARLEYSGCGSGYEVLPRTVFGETERRSSFCRMADAEMQRCEQFTNIRPAGIQQTALRSAEAFDRVGDFRAAPLRLANANLQQSEQFAGKRARPGEAQGGRAFCQPSGCGDALRLADSVPTGRPEGRTGPRCGQAVGGGGFGGVGDTSGAGLQERNHDGRIQCRTVGADARETAIGVGDTCGLVHAANIHCEKRPEVGGLGSTESSFRQETWERNGQANRTTGAACGLANPESPRWGICDTAHIGAPDAPLHTFANPSHGASVGQQQPPAANPGPTNGFWRDVDWLFCRDEFWRPVKPGTFPLAYGATNRVGRLRGYGNAVNAEAAKEFISAFMQFQEFSNVQAHQR